MEKVKDVSNQKIGEELERMCRLSDVQYPEDGKGLVDVIKQVWSDQDSSVIRKSVDYYLTGQSVAKPKQRLTAPFLNSLIREYISIHSGAKSFNRQANTQHIQTDEEWMAGYNLCYKQYKDSLGDDGNRYTFIPMVAQALNAWILSKGGYRNPPSETAIEICKEELAEYVTAWERHTQMSESFTVKDELVRTLAAKQMAAINVDAVATIMAHFKMRMSKQ